MLYCLIKSSLSLQMHIPTGTYTVWSNFYIPYLSQNKISSITNLVVAILFNWALIFLDQANCWDWRCLEKGSIILWGLIMQVENNTGWRIQTLKTALAVLLSHVCSLVKRLRDSLACNGRISVSFCICIHLLKLKT